MSIAEELHDRRGHEVKGQAIEQRVCGIHMREAGCEESPSNKQGVGDNNVEKGWIHIHATRSDVVHVDAKVVEHELQQSTITGGALCCRW